MSKYYKTIRRIAIKFSLQQQARNSLVFVGRQCVSGGLAGVRGIWRSEDGRPKLFASRRASGDCESCHRRTTPGRLGSSLRPGRPWCREGGDSLRRVSHHHPEKTPSERGARRGAWDAAHVSKFLVRASWKLDMGQQQGVIDSGLSSDTMDWSPMCRQSCRLYSTISTSMTRLFISPAPHCEPSRRIFMPFFPSFPARCEPEGCLLGASVDTKRHCNACGSFLAC